MTLRHLLPEYSRLHSTLRDFQWSTFAVFTHQNYRQKATS